MRQVLPVVGAAIGAYFGNGEGAQIGWAIGSVVGNAVDPEVIKGPSIGDIAQQTSQEGVPRPMVFALSQPISGNIVACSLPRIVNKKSSSGKGGPVTETQSVYRTYAIAICEGPITAIIRCWNNGKLIYDSRPGQPDPGNAAFLANAEIFLGSFDQMPSAELEAIFGVGNVPAMRGTCYICWHDIDLTANGGAVPQYIFQVLRCEGELLTSNLYPIEFMDEMVATPEFDKLQLNTWPQEKIIGIPSFRGVSSFGGAKTYSVPFEKVVGTPSIIGVSVFGGAKAYTVPPEKIVGTPSLIGVSVFGGADVYVVPFEKIVGTPALTGVTSV